METLNREYFSLLGARTSDTDVYSSPTTYLCTLLTSNGGYTSVQNLTKISSSYIYTCNGSSDVYTTYMPMSNFLKIG